MVEHSLAKADTGGSIPSSAPFKIKYWSSGVVVNMPPCHGGDRGFESHLDRHLEI